MKHVLLILLLLPLGAFAQRKVDYVYAMNRFVNFYNEKRGDAINDMFSSGWDEAKKTRPLWTNKQCAEMLQKYGRIQSFKFIGIDSVDPNKVYVFRTVFSKAGKKTTSLTLDKENHLGTFRFITSSEEISRLVAEDEAAKQ